MSEFAEVLQQTHAAVKVSFSWLGMKKALEEDQREKAADVFLAKCDSLSASKKLLDTKDDNLKAVGRVKSETVKYWKNNTLPFPEDGVRLLKREMLPAFQAKMDVFKSELAEAVFKLNGNYEALKEQAARDLGELFNADDYPSTLEGKFSMTWHTVNTSPPDYLKETMPGLYKLEQERIARQMEAAVSLAEKSFTQEFAKLVGNLVDQLEGTRDGRSKRFSKSHLTNIKTFFDKFRELDLGSDEQLGDLVEQAKQVCDGVTVRALKDSETLQDKVAESMGEIGKKLSDMVELKPARQVSFDEEE